MKTTTCIAITALAAVLASCVSKTGNTVYEFTQVSRGTLEKTVSSTGTLNPVATVKVLPQMNGKVEKIYVDYNDPVSRGQVLAELNTDMLRLQREQQAAQVIKARANYAIQEVNYRNQAQLAEKNLISEYELNTAKTSLDVQAAELAAAEANFKATETEINQYAYITSPIDGIVLERAITTGDTVVSGSGSSAIFTLAENLTEMQIESSVGELDISSIKKGQAVRFTLESLPGRTYGGTVETIHFIPKVQSNVVSYTVIINTDNQDGSLLPGMTCAVEFIEERNENVLRVPNAALRYQPSALSAEAVANLKFNAGLKGMDEAARTAAITARSETQGQTGTATQNRTASTGLAELVSGGGSRAPGAMGGGGMGGGMMGGPPGAPGGGMGSAAGGAAGASAAQGGAVSLKTLWYVDANGKPDCVMVQAGISDGSYTEVSPADFNTELEGMRIILREKV